MRVGFDAKRIFHNITGLGNYSRDTVRIMSSYFSKNSYFLYNPKPGKIDRLKIADNLKVCFPKSKVWQKLNSLWRQKAIVKDLVSDKIEIYHGLTNELPVGIETTNIKTVVTIHDLIFVRYPELYSYIDGKIHYKKFKRAAQVADKVIAISEQTKRDIVEFLQVSPTKIEVVYQGCHSAFQKDYTSKEKEQVAKKYDLPNKYLLNVGTIQERKNLLTIVKAIKNTNHYLVVVGKETNYADKVKAYIKENNMQNRVCFLKGVSMEELAIIYQKTSIFIYPSIFEGFGIPIVEALYSKTPVISSVGSCFSEAGGPDSIYIEPHDDLALLKEINRIENDTLLQDKMKEQGWNYAQQFNDTVIANAIMDLYKGL
ncbi:glycosyltransferase involved in cell wall biosynthesis [Wenyingzhuangia heitensis]|uniref:Glycosyltransferase involved in cell wall biosynthesis n=1 Tax=Wenyingzhuangia heitensis TaxID=1487859 RepID=A0ABX0UBQ8_9FLAO|nr:glycosyltransferase family 1 protein [Wenyingzhuangia heitensis]NIJ45774.1 glycosyltransferase involved in cell wall biosynthesis [Wenyingzhuangia heitensis]